MPDTPLNQDARRRCVHLLLAYSGTPWDDLYEYPHRRDDSDRYVANAESMLDQILEAAQPARWEMQAKNFMRVIDRLSAENDALKAAALPEVTTVEEVARLWRQVSEAIDHEHLDPREFVDLGGLKFLLGQILDSFRPEVKP